MDRILKSALITHQLKNNFIKKDQLKNVGILINGVNMKTSSGYGYGKASTYQYQEVKKKKPWYKRS